MSLRGQLSRIRSGARGSVSHSTGPWRQCPASPGTCAVDDRSERASMSAPYKLGLRVAWAAPPASLTCCVWPLDPVWPLLSRSCVMLFRSRMLTVLSLPHCVASAPWAVELRTVLQTGREHRLAVVQTSACAP